MQTFLPYADFDKTAECLDYRRLGKQRVEVLQILRTLNAPPEASSPWRNHPAVLMWNGYTEALVEYGLAICEEWVSRGYKDNCFAKISDFSWGDEIKNPPWLGKEEFHSSHRAALLRKGADDQAWKFFSLNFKEIPCTIPLPLKKHEWTPRHFDMIRKEFSLGFFSHYSEFNWTEEPLIPDAKGSLPYYWPTKEAV